MAGSVINGATPFSLTPKQLSSPSGSQDIFHVVNFMQQLQKWAFWVDKECVCCWFVFVVLEGVVVVVVMLFMVVVF